MENLNYYKISHYEPYDGSDDIIVGHKSRFTDTEDLKERFNDEFD